MICTGKAYQCVMSATKSGNRLPKTSIFSCQASLLKQFYFFNLSVALVVEDRRFRKIKALRKGIAAT